jgi:hypothetical protein
VTSHCVIWPVVERFHCLIWLSLRRRFYCDYIFVVLRAYSFFMLLLVPVLSSTQIQPEVGWVA